MVQNNHKTSIPWGWKLMEDHQNLDGQQMDPPLSLQVRLILTQLHECEDSLETF